MQPQLDAMIQILTMALALWIVLFLNRDFIRKSLDRLGSRYRYVVANEKIIQRITQVVIFGIPVLFILIFGFTQYPVLVQDSMNRQIAKSLDSMTGSNAYVIPTADPIFRKGVRDYSYSLLLEFGVNRTETLVNVSIETRNEIKLHDYFFGKPRQAEPIKPDSLLLEERSGSITLRFGGSTTPEVSATSYHYESEMRGISTDKSYYVYLESDAPFNDVVARFSDALLVIHNGQIQE